MSAGHHHHGGTGQSSIVIDRLLKNPEVSSRLYRAGHVNRDFDLPYLGGYSKDGKTIYMDRHLPDQLEFEADGHKHEFDPIKFVTYHEEFEKAVMDGLGWHYAHAHAAATGFERRHVLKAGLPWKGYSAVLEPFIKADEHERLEKVPADLDMAPYYAPPVSHKLIARMQKVMGHDEGKKSKDEVNYSDGHPGTHCGPVKGWPRGDCINFQSPNNCTFVRGYISPRKWCSLWESKS